MGIGFIYGRAGSGKSSFCLNQIKKKLETDSNRKLIYIVPEQYTFQRETMLLKKVSEKGLLRIEVLSFKRMAHKVFDECGGRVHNIMKDSGRSMLIYKILQEENEGFQYFNRIYKEKGFTDIISKTLTELKKYNIYWAVKDEIEKNKKENININNLDNYSLKDLEEIRQNLINSKSKDDNSKKLVK